MFLHNNYVNSLFYFQYATYFLIIYTDNNNGLCSYCITYLPQFQSVRLSYIGKKCNFVDVDLQNEASNLNIYHSQH